MRDAFTKALAEAANRDPRVVLMTGDLGFGVLNEYRARFPDQFLNVGVAEQNLAGVAAGLALTGDIVFTYSIGNFPILRCLEQIRNDICYHNANVKIVTVGGGLAYGALGVTHYAVEDLAIMRALPGIAVVAPGDPLEVERLVPQLIEREGPAYLRLGRAGERQIVPASATVELGVPTRVREGADLLLLTTGGMLPVAIDAAAQLERVGIQAAVMSMHTLSPIHEPIVLDILETFPLVITCEEHSVRGGLAGAIAELAAEAGLRTRLRRFGLPSAFPRGIGSQEYLRSVNGIDATALTALAVASNNYGAGRADGRERELPAHIAAGIQ